MKLVGPALSAIETVTEAIVKVVPDTVPRSVVRSTLSSATPVLPAATERSVSASRVSIKSLMHVPCHQSATFVVNAHSKRTGVLL